MELDEVSKEELWRALRPIVERLVKRPLPPKFIESGLKLWREHREHCTDPDCLMCKEDA